MNESTKSTGRRIYVACLASYNAGTLHGEWIDADQDADVIHEEIQTILRRSPHPNVMVDCPECENCESEGCSECGGKGQVPSAEEWAIHDYEGFGDIKLGEGESIERVAEIAELLAEHGLAFAAYVDHVGADFGDEQGFQDAYCGEWDTEVAYAENLFDECYAHEIPENLRYYIDYEAFSRDLFMSDNYSVDNPSGGVFVFRHN